MRDLVNVEAIPFDVLNMGITWDWETFPDFMEAAARRRPSLNLGFLAPLTPFRHYVMGEASLERAATPDETAQIKALLGEAIDAGAFGFSTTILNQHVGFQGRPLACRNASRDELKSYANALKERGKGAIEIALTRKIAVLDDEEYELLDFLLRESGQPVTFLALFDRDDIPEAVRETLRKAAPLIARGARPQTSPLPLTRDINMRNPFSFAAFPSWNRVFVDKSKPAQAAVYADVAFRNQFREELKQPMAFGNWARINVHEVRSPALKALEGRSIADIAREQGKDGVDAFLDLTLQDDLDIEFTMASFNTRVDRMTEILNDKSVLVALPARHMGARAPGVDAGRRGAATHLGSGRCLRHPGSRPARPRPRRRPGHLRRGPRRLDEPWRASVRPARRRQAHGHAVARRRAHGGQRRGHLGGRKAHRSGRGPGAAVLAATV
jgi:N-acyl-D-aspartate/D-glutamate deacylase